MVIRKHFFEHTDREEIAHRFKYFAEARLINSRTMFPLRFVGESFGKQVHWDGKYKFITIE